MIFGQDRRTLRRMYVDAWKKARDGAPMSALEKQIAAVVADHPEYHAVLDDEQLEAEFTPEMGMSNPFLHMGLHLAIRDQVATDRPPGVRAVFEQLAARHGERLAAEHAMIEVLATSLWDAQRSNKPPDEFRYLEDLKRLASERV